MANYLEFRMGGRRRGAREAVALPDELLYTPPTVETQPDFEELKNQALSELAQLNGATSEEVTEALKYTEQHPEYASQIRNDLRASLQRARSLSPDALQATIESEMAIFNNPNADPAEVERLQKNGVLVPLLMAKQATSAEAATQEITHASSKRVGRFKRNNRRVARSVIGGTAAVITLGSAYLDFTFAKEGLSEVVDVLVEKLGLENTMRIVGDKLAMTANLVAGSQPVQNAFEQAQYGKGALTMAIVLSALGYLGVQKYHSEKFRDLFRFKRHPVKATVNAALVFAFLGFGSGNVTKGLGEVLKSKQLGTEITTKYKPSKEKLAGAVKSAENLRQQVQPLIATKVETAFRTGVAKVGPLTASSWLALNGNVPYKDNKLIAEAYEGQDANKMTLIANAVKAVNAREEYKKLGMTEKDGATQLLKYLTADLPSDAKDLSDHFDRMLAIADDKATITLARSIFGKVNPLDPSFYKGKVSMSTLFEMQKQYPEKYTALIQKVLALETLNKYLGDVEAQLKKDAQVNVNLRVDLKLPDLGYTQDQIKALTISDAEYKDVLNPSKIDNIVNLFWGTQKAWEARGQIVARDLVANRIGDKSGDMGVFLQRLGYEAAIYSAFFGLVIGSVIASGMMRKRLNRWKEADLDEFDEKIGDKEDELVDAMVAYAQTLSASAVKTLREANVATEATNLVNPAFMQAVSHALRREILKDTIDPRTKKPLSESPESADFLNRTGTRYFDDELRKQILNRYAAQLDSWREELRAKPFETIEKLLKTLGSEHAAVAEALTRVNTTNPGTREQAEAVATLRSTFGDREKQLMTIEANQALLHIARLQARRDAVEKMVQAEDDVDIVLGSSESAPTLTTENIVASYILSDIDSEIHGWEKAVGELQERGATPSPVSDSAKELTDAEWEAERAAFMTREMNRLAEGTEIAADGTATLEKFNAFIASLNGGLIAIREDLETHLKQFNPNANVSFVYSQSALREGPTLIVRLTDSTAPNAAMASIPFKYKIPSAEGRETAKILSDVKEWAQPEGVLAQQLRVSTIFEKTRADYRSELALLRTLGPLNQLELDAVTANSDLVNSFIKTSDIMREQKKLMEKLLAGTPLEPEEVRVFLAPEVALRDVWRGSIIDALNRAQRGKFASPTGRRLVLAFDADDKGYFVAAPENAQLPIALEEIPEASKMLVKRAAIA